MLIHRLLAVGERLALSCTNWAVFVESCEVMLTYHWLVNSDCRYICLKMQKLDVDLVALFPR